MFFLKMVDFPISFIFLNSIQISKVYRQLVSAVHCTLFGQILANNMYIKIRSAGSGENNLSKLDSSGKVKALLTVDFFFLSCIERSFSSTAKW